MNYRWKDVYITILPGFLLIIYSLLTIYLADYNCILQCVECISTNSKVSSVVDNDGLTVVAVSFISLAIGYFLNGASSLIEHRMYGSGKRIFPSIKEQKSDKETNKKANVDLRKRMHRAMTILPPNPKIEEYYVRYAQARNMLFMHVICFFISLICSILAICLSSGCYCIGISFGITIIQIVAGSVYYLLYFRHRKRYEEVTIDECECFLERNNCTYPDNKDTKMK